MDNQNNNEQNFNNNFGQALNNNLNNVDNQTIEGTQNYNINQSTQTLNQMTNQSINSQIQESQIQPMSIQPQMQQNNEISQTNNTEIDDTFVEPKKKPIGAIFLLIFLLLIIGGIAYYYFVLDNPKTIFTTAINKVFDKVNIEDPKRSGTIDYSLNLNITSPNKEMKDILDIINQFKLSGNVSIDNNLNELNGIINYKDKQLLNYNILVDSGENPAVYAKSSDLYDKIIKIELEEDESTDYDTNINDYKQIVSSIKNALNSSLENANYEKKLVKLNNETVKKISLKIDEEFLVNIYNKLLQDNSFISSYANIKNMTNEEISDLLNKDITDAEGNNEILNLYLTSFKNEFLKFEYVSDKDSLTITKDNDKYNFDLSESYTSIYQGYVKLTEVNNKNNLTFSVSLIEEELNIDANIEYTIDETNKINFMDISDSVNLDELSEEETNKITENIFKNEAFNSLMEDVEKIMPTDDNSLTPSSDI